MHHVWSSLCCILAISYTVGFVSRTAFFDWSPNRALSHSSRNRAFSLLFSTEFSNWGIQSFLGDPVFFEPIAYRLSHHQAHTHTPTHPYQVPHSSIIQGADAGLAITALASRRKSTWRIPSYRSLAACITRRQQRAVSIPFCEKRLRLL